jgi:hypothetical protein
MTTTRLLVLLRRARYSWQQPAAALDRRRPTVDQLPDGRPGSACTCGRTLIADDMHGTATVAGVEHNVDTPCLGRRAADYAAARMIVAARANDRRP